MLATTFRRRFSAATLGKPTLPSRPYINFRALVDNEDFVARNVWLRGLADIDVHAVVSLYRRFGRATFELQGLRNRRSAIADLIKKAAKPALAQEKTRLMEEGKNIRLLLQEAKKSQRLLENQLYALAEQIPNNSDPSSPIGPQSEAKVIQSVQGIVHHASACRSHLDIAKLHDLLDLTAAAKVSGSSFYYLRNEAALLELALVQYAMHLAVQRGFTPIITPDIVKSQVSTACGFQPRDPRQTQNYSVRSNKSSIDFDNNSSSSSSNDLNNIDSSTGLVLTGTAEIPLAGIYANSVLSEAQLPIHMVAFGRSFRAEAGAHGTESKGLYRVHQFSKVELFSIVTPQHSKQELNRLLAFQIDLFTQLGLTFRVLDMPTEELGASAFKKYDIEAWMIGRGEKGDWGEISSASNCTDYQARRLGIRYYPSITTTKSLNIDMNTSLNSQSDNLINKTAFVHTLNATACAIPRMIISILEQHQLMDGRVVIPPVLRPWMCGKAHIGKEVIIPAQ